MLAGRHRVRTGLHMNHLKRASEAGQSVTIVDVASRAGVSIKTVSRVVNCEPNVRGSTRKRVDDAIAELQYRPNEAARFLASQRGRKAQ